MELKHGYKQTEVGSIPEDWDLHMLVSLTDPTRTIRYGIVQPGNYSVNGTLMLRSQDYSKGWAEASTMHRATNELAIQYQNARLKTGDLVMTVVGANTGQVVEAPDWLDGGVLSRSTARIAINKDKANTHFIKFFLQSKPAKRQLLDHLKEGAQPVLSCVDLANFRIPLPSNKAEQEAIASALSDVDALLTSLDALIAKKRAIKQGAMQELLTGRMRLPGFSGVWENKTLKEITDCLDNLRIPLNENQRATMQGYYPYCGANGVLDFVNDYIINDNIILMAEDGGYFDEYDTRPIAYRMSGKCWVNNHAHILKAKENYDQDFIFYSLVNKNILRFLASGTRAKLNKHEMYKIEITIPREQQEQRTISKLLLDMDTEISALEQRREKTRLVKQGMMQELLTGRTRLNHD